MHKKNAPKAGIFVCYMRNFIKIYLLVPGLFI